MLSSHNITLWVFGWQLKKIFEHLTKWSHFIPEMGWIGISVDTTKQFYLI